MITRKIASLNQRGELEFISLFLQHLGSERHIKFPVINRLAQKVPFYDRLYGEQLASELLVYANETIQNEDYTDIV